jgi:DNA-binding NtrC family response regulator
MTARLLIVDDEVDTCANLRDIFTDLGYETDVAYDGRSALKLVEKNQYDIALLDLRMPGMDGLELYHRIREISAGTVAIVVTAYATSETASSIKRAGAWKIISKPVDLEMLMSAINTAVEQPTVLVVDDDKDLCDTLWDVFREHGLRVCVAHDRGEAAERIRGRKHQVVIIDLKLPGGTGMDVLQDLRAANPSARSILITGYRDEMEGSIQSAMSKGVDAVAYKPFDVDALLSTIRKLVSAS